LADMASNLHHEAETAIRALARSDAFAEEVQRRVDDERMEAVAATLRELGFSADDAERYAAMSLALLVGAQHLGADRRSVADVLRAPVDFRCGALTALLPTGSPPDPCPRPDRDRTPGDTMNTTGTPTPVDEYARLFTEPAAWADMDAWHDKAGELRRTPPVLRSEQEGVDPQWGLGRHAALFPRAPARRPPPRP